LLEKKVDKRRIPLGGSLNTSEEKEKSKKNVTCFPNVLIDGQRRVIGKEGLLSLLFPV